MATRKTRERGDSAPGFAVAEQHIWPQIGDIVLGHDGYRPDPVTDLDGETIRFTSGDTPLAMTFASGSLTLNDTNGSRSVEAQVFRVREDVYFIDCQHVDAEISSAICLDRARGVALVIEVVAPIPGVPAGLLERVEAHGSQSAVGITYRIHSTDETKGELYPRSAALIGSQFRYTYSSSHIYDHFYLSDRYYCWFCRQGPDAGLGDFEECDYFEVAEDLILVCWREKLLPCVGITLEDHQAMRSVGKIFGADTSTGLTANSTVGAYITKIADIGWNALK